MTETNKNPISEGKLQNLWHQMRERRKSVAAEIRYLEDRAEPLRQTLGDIDVALVETLPAIAAARGAEGKLFEEVKDE